MGGRFILGFGVAITSTAGPAYASEMAHPAYRGVLTGIFNTFWFVGGIPGTFVPYGTSNISGTMAWRIPIWLQMVPQTARSQYLLFWYVAETLPASVEEQLNKQEDASEASIFGAPYQYPPEFPIELTFKDRLAMEPKGYEPIHHTGTSADEEEMLYESHLLSIPEAITKLGNSHQADVVKLGWDAIKLRLASEK